MRCKEKADSYYVVEKIERTLRNDLKLIDNFYEGKEFYYKSMDI